MVDKLIALAQTYFTIRTRKQELSEREYSKLSEIHYKVGKEIRNTIKKLKGKLTEDLPNLEKSLM